jgi:hypothetical protein
MRTLIRGRVAARFFKTGRVAHNGISRRYFAASLFHSVILRLRLWRNLRMTEWLFRKYFSK